MSCNWLFGGFAQTQTIVYPSVVEWHLLFFAYTISQVVRWVVGTQGAGLLCYIPLVKQARLGNIKGDALRSDPSCWDLLGHLVYSCAVFNALARAPPWKPKASETQMPSCARSNCWSASTFEIRILL